MHFTNDESKSSSYQRKGKKENDEIESLLCMNGKKKTQINGTNIG